MNLAKSIPEGHRIDGASFRVKPAPDGQIHIRCELASTPTPADLIYILPQQQAEQLVAAITACSILIELEKKGVEG